MTPRNPADRPATEPRTEAGRRMLRRRSYWSGNDDIRAAILAIEAEAARGAAPLDDECALCHHHRAVHEGSEYPPDAPTACIRCGCPAFMAFEGADATGFGAPTNRMSEFLPQFRERLSEGAAPRAEGPPDELTMSEWGRLQDSLHDHFDEQGVTGVDVDKLIEHLVNERLVLADALGDLMQYEHPDKYAAAFGLLSRLAASGVVVGAAPRAEGPREHLTDEADPLACWCQPYRDTEEPEVIIHRKEGEA